MLQLHGAWQTMSGHPLRVDVPSLYEVSALQHGRRRVEQFFAHLSQALVLVRDFAPDDRRTTDAAWRTLPPQSKSEASDFRWRWAAQWVELERRQLASTVF